MKLKHEIKVGIFIIISIALLTYVLMWLHKFDISSYIKLTARFKDVGTLGIGSSVLYRGVKAGTVHNIIISKDGQHALVKINITNKDIKIYEGSIASVVDKSFTGTKALIINPPQDCKNKRILESGDIIEGKPSFNFEELQKLLTKLSNEGKLDSIINDTQKLVSNTNDLTERLNSLLEKTEVLLTEENSEKLTAFLDTAIVLSKDLNISSKHFNKFISNPNLNQAINSSGKTVENLNQVVNKTDKLVDKSGIVVDNLNTTMTRLDDTVNNPDLHGSIRSSMEKMSDILQDIKEITGKKEFKEDVLNTVEKSSNSLDRINCLSQELGATLGKRFLIPRMIIGKPGNKINTCLQPEHIIEETKNGNNNE